MNYIVIELCCSSCRRFEDLHVINCENYLDLKQILKDMYMESGNTFYVYDMKGFHIETLFD